MFNPWHDKRLNLILRELARVHHQLERIMTTQADEVVVLQGMQTTLDTIATEVDSLQAEVVTLQGAAGQAADLSPDLQAAIDAVASRVNTLATKAAPAPAPAPTDGASAPTQS
jgi:hypothetical protein